MNIRQWLQSRRVPSTVINKAYEEAKRRRELLRRRRKNPCRGIVGPKVTDEWRWVAPPAIVNNFVK